MPWNAWMPSQLSHWERVSSKSDFIINVFIKILDLPTILVDLLMHMHVESWTQWETGCLGCKEIQAHRVLPESLVRDLDAERVL